MTQYRRNENGDALSRLEKEIERWKSRLLVDDSRYSIKKGFAGWLYNLFNELKILLDLGENSKKMTKVFSKKKL